MNAASPQNRRRMRLVDHVIQKSLLVALVVTEIVATALAIWSLYRALGAILDDNMYRIHFTATVNMSSLLLREGLRVLGGMLLVNFLALVIADRVWAFYVSGIVRNLDGMLHASGRLDFTKQEAPPFNHAVLEQAQSWRATEAARLAAMRDAIRRLPPQLPELAQDRAALAAALKKIQDD